MKTARRIYWETAQRLYPGSGCGDGACIFGHPGGMQTNGGCHCRDEAVGGARHVALQLRSIAMDLAKQLAEKEVPHV